MIEISTDKTKLQVNLIHEFLTETYWAKGRTIEEVKRTIENSLCFGVYFQGKQIGFARIVTDYTVFTYLMDVFILPEYRGKGYSKQLMNVILEHPDLKTCKVWTLKTLDAHGLYQQFGYNKPENCDKIMERILK